jgi:hypothetical protein
VTFEKRIRVTIEHGHANKRSDDYSSVAFWYQTEPHKPFSILPVDQRIPRSEQEWESHLQNTPIALERRRIL